MQAALMLIALSLSSLDRSVVRGLHSTSNLHHAGGRGHSRGWRIRTTSNRSSSICNDDAVAVDLDAIAVDLWNADGPLEEEWSSSLPLPENALHDPSLADRARNAMAGVHPTALEGRCRIDLERFDGRLKWLHVDPPVVIVDNFLSDVDCTKMLELQSVSPPMGAGRVIKIESRLSDSDSDSDSNTSRSNSHHVRSSTTWYARYGAPAVAPLLSGLLALLPNVALEQLEEVQLVRYEGGGQGFSWHEDVVNVDDATVEAGGQRIATCLVYLNECDGGRTLFRDLRGEDGNRLGVSPKKGRALLFFPCVTGTSALGLGVNDGASTANTDSHSLRIASLGDGTSIANADSSSKLRSTFGRTYLVDDTRADHRTSHAGEPPGNHGQKNIAQLWIHSREHTPIVFGGGLNRHAEACL